MAKTETDSDRIKEFLEEMDDIQAPIKRIAKKKGANGVVYRTFKDASGYEFHVVGDAGDESYPWPVGPVLFSIWTNPNWVAEDDGWEREFNVSFNPKKYWDENKCLYDQHVQYTLETLMDLPDCLEGEDMENSFSVVPGKTYKEIMDALLALGYVHCPEQEAFVQRIPQ